MSDTTQESTLCADDAVQVNAEQAEAVRYEGNETYHIMADAMPQIVWSARPDGSRDYFNQRWVEHTQMTTAQTKAWGWLAALHPKDRERCRHTWAEAAQGNDAFEVEYRLLCAEEGSYRWHLERALPVFDPQGQVVKWFGTCTDIDELKDAKEQIETLNTRLRRAMVETHHRVKNNLQIISAMIDMQLMNGGDAIAAAEFQRLSSHVRTLSAVHDLLTREAKEEAGPQQALSLEDVLYQLLPVHQQTAPHCRITARIEDVALPGRQGTSLALVINELISNAIKHGQGAVEIVVASEGGQVMVTVCDDGPGFPADFDPNKAANTGLELIHSLVRWDLAGQITFANQLQGGAQVTISFPAARPL
jgi:PAS domain S-box-containing protein